jgi:hypothetical protein
MGCGMRRKWDGMDDDEKYERHRGKWEIGLWN